jgi:hypothetical protein
MLLAAVFFGTLVLVAIIFIAGFASYRTQDAQLTGTQSGIASTSSQ